VITQAVIFWKRGLGPFAIALLQSSAISFAFLVCPDIVWQVRVFTSQTESGSSNVLVLDFLGRQETGSGYVLVSAVLEPCSSRDQAVIKRRAVRIVLAVIYKPFGM